MPDKVTRSPSPCKRLPPFRAGFMQVINSNDWKENPTTRFSRGLGMDHPKHLSDILEELPGLGEKPCNLRFSYLAEIDYNRCYDIHAHLLQ
jgi:hypothetical protein